MANTVSASADPVPHQPQKEAEHMDRRPKAAQGFEAAYDACQRRRGFVVFRRTENVEKWRVKMYSL